MLNIHIDVLHKITKLSQAAVKDRYLSNFNISATNVRLHQYRNPTYVTRRQAITRGLLFDYFIWNIQPIKYIYFELFMLLNESVKYF